MSYLNTTGVISIDNSSTTLLTNGETFTGIGELNAFPDVIINIKTDQNGTFYAEFSIDGTNWDTSLSFKYNTTRINPPHILVKGKRYFRLRFTNDSGFDQTYFRCQVDYGAFNKLTAPLNGIVSENYDAIITRPSDYYSEVAMGKRQGRTLWNKFGYNNDVDNGITEAVVSYGGTFTRITTACTLSIVSSSALDLTGTGTGTRSVVIYGVDENHNSVIEVVQLNGTTPVITTNLYFGVNRIATYLAGSLGANAGVITATATIGATVQAEIPIGEGTTQQAIFFTQANHTALMGWLLININKIAGGSSPTVTIRAWVLSEVSGAKYQVFKYTMDTAVENHLELTPPQAFVVGEKSILYFTATSDTNNTIVNVRFTLIEERNS